MKKLLCALMISAVIPTMALADGVDEALRESAAGSYYGKYNSSTYPVKKDEVVATTVKKDVPVFYVTPRIGASYMELLGTGDYDGLGLMANIAAGVYLTDNVRADVEVGYHFKREMAISRESTPNMSSRETDDVRQVDVMANVYYDFNADEAFKPFVGIGAGYARIKDTVEYSETTGFALQESETIGRFATALSVGFAYELTDNVAFEMLGRGKYIFNIDDMMNLETLGGLRFSF